MVISPDKINEGIDEQTTAIKEVISGVKESVEKKGESIEVQKLQENSGEKIRKIDELKTEI